MCVTFPLWICALINKLKGWHSATESCVLLRTQTGTNTPTHTHTQFEDDGCLACWPCYPLPSQHILSKTFAVLALYYMSGWKSKGGDSEGNRDRKRETYSCCEMSAERTKKKCMTPLLFFPSFSSESEWLINNVVGVCGGLVGWWAGRDLVKMRFGGFCWVWQLSVGVCVREGDGVRPRQIGFAKRQCSRAIAKKLTHIN